MKKLKTQFVVKILGLAAVAVMLNACSNEAETWSKNQSPWDQRKNTAVEAPAAETYKADLEMPAEQANEVELSYQTESVESFAPEAVAVVAVAEETSDVSIMDQPAKYFTMQLMASVDIDRVLRFAEQNQISTQYVVPTERDGVIWHVLLLDVYPDYASALAASDEIAPRLKNKPWIRSVGSVQKLVR